MLLKNRKKLISSCKGRGPVTDIKIYKIVPSFSERIKEWWKDWYEVGLLLIPAVFFLILMLIIGV